MASRAQSLSVPELVQGVSAWQQVNSNGFGDPKELEVSALESFNSNLYAGTYNLVEPQVVFDGARIFRSSNGVQWTAVTQPGFQNPHDSAPPAILDFVVFGSYLYASTGRGGNAAQIWRSSTGSSWMPAFDAGPDYPDTHDIAALTFTTVRSMQEPAARPAVLRSSAALPAPAAQWYLETPTPPTMAGAVSAGLLCTMGHYGHPLNPKRPCSSGAVPVEPGRV
jgi:hypothetical protein